MDVNDAVEQVCHRYFTRPEFRTYVRDHYSDVDQAMVSLRDSDKRGLEELAVSVVGEVRAGGKYLLRIPDKTTAETAHQIQQQLTDRFPGVTFALITPDIEVVEDWRTELVSAIQRAGNKLQLQFLNASNDSTKQTSYAGMAALRVLQLELLAAPERADTPPESGPVARASSPDPMCGAHHPSLQIRCALPLGHEHSGPKRHAGEAQDCEVRWT